MKIKGGAGWALLATYVALYDYVAIKNNGETLSAAFARSMNHPIGRWATITLVSTILKHLLAPTVLPEIDPLNYIAGRWRKGVELRLAIAMDG